MIKQNVWLTTDDGHKIPISAFQLNTHPDLPQDSEGLSNYYAEIGRGINHPETVTISGSFTGFADIFDTFCNSIEWTWRYYPKSKKIYYGPVRKPSKQTRAFLRTINKPEKHYTVPARPRKLRSR